MTLQRAVAADGFSKFGSNPLNSFCARIAETIMLFTECLTLEPGDVIVMGTPAGVGYARKPPVWMKQGDIIEVEIEGIGVLSNPIRDESPAA